MTTNFTFIDDVITIPYKTVTSSDSAVLIDNVSSIFLDSVVDSLSLTDILLTLSVSVANIDSVTFNEFIDIRLSSSDSLSLSDSNGGLFLTNQDSIALSESIAASLSSSDSSLLVEITQILLDNIQDFSTLSEFVNTIDLNALDSGIESENVQVFTDLVASDSDGFLLESSNFVAAEAPGTDNISTTDIPLISAELSSDDLSNLFEDTSNIGFRSQDQSNLAEFVEIAPEISDDAQLSESTLSNVNAESSDSSSLIETPNISNDIGSSDTSSASDQFDSLEADAIGLEQIQLSENVSIEVYVIENITLFEAVSNSLSSLDESNLTDTPIIGAIASDISTLQDFVGVEVSASTDDVGQLTEINNGLLLNVKETATLIEIPYYDANYSRLDYFFLISEIARATILKEDFDIFVVTDFNISISPNTIQLITFKEKTAIGTAAPIVLNVNDTPTVHGSVTGDIIDISVGGTEPVLL